MSNPYELNNIKMRCANMCTGLSIQSQDGKWFFGRNMDLAYHFNQSVMIIPRNYQ